MYEVRATRLEEKEDSKVIGLASVVVDGRFAFNNIQVVKSSSVERGWFLSMPSYKKADGEYVDIFHPIQKGFSAALADAVDKAMSTGDKYMIGTEETSLKIDVEAVDFPKTKGFVKMKFGEEMVCNSAQIRLSGEGNPFLSMPSYKTKNGEYKDFCNPTTREFKQWLDEFVMDKYETSKQRREDEREKRNEQRVTSYTVAPSNPAPSH